MSEYVTLRRALYFEKFKKMKSSLLQKPSEQPGTGGARECGGWSARKSVSFGVLTAHAGGVHPRLNEPDNASQHMLCDTHITD